ncbi:MAG: ATP-binding protein [Bacteroidota bacterium]
MAGKLSDRLREASRRLFVGRSAQRKLFETVLSADTHPFALLHIYGPGGIGKTSLLYEYRHLCEAAHIPVLYLDTRTIEADPAIFLSAIRQQLGIANNVAPADMLGAEGKHVLMLDTYESMFALEQWLYTSFFPELNDTVFIVVAGRYPPSPTWTDNPGWRSLIKTVALRNFSPDESRTYLSRVGMPEDFQQPAINYTHGHPLALSLVAESFTQTDAAAFDGELEPDFIKVLLDRFVREAPSLDHRLALEACVLVNNLTEPLLATMLERTDVRALFEWLRSLSFIDSGTRGLFPHDLAREVLGSELRWRNPDQHKVLHQQARVYYNAQLKDASSEEQGNVLKDYIFLHRDNAIVRPFFLQLQSQWQGSTAAISTDQYHPRDLAQIEAMVTKHEGEASAALARMWIEAQPEHVILFRDQQGDAAGFLLLLALHDASETSLKKDPVAQACVKYLNTNAPLRPGEAATLFRFWMDRDAYQNITQVQSLIFVYMVRHYLTTSKLAFSMLPISSPSFWKSVFGYADLHHLESLDFERNGIPFGVFGHDWRSRPPAAWLDVLASRETGSGFSGTAEATPQRTMLVLSEEAFGEAVRMVCRNYTRRDRLVNNPLLSSRIVADSVAESADDAERVEVLMQLVDDGVALLQQNVKQAKAFKALDRTYLRPAASQEQAAELLGLPYSTFRRHLATALNELIQFLWQKELGR